MLLLLTVAAQAFSPLLSIVQPPGGQRGTTVQLHFHGERLADVKEILCYQKGLAITDIKVVDDKHFTAMATIAADAPLGEHPLRVRCSGGISEMKLFMVGQFPCVDEV
jgi:hypothetical protein